MSAGTGIQHSEFNASSTEPVHFLQIWIIPDTKGLKPGYEQVSFSAESKRGQLRLVGSRTARNGSVTIHRDVDLYASLLGSGDSVTHKLEPGRGLWIQVARGSAVLNDTELSAGDGAAVDVSDAYHLSGSAPESEVLLFDIAM
jgi:redox-sensitive bicupin YhaK (pirin superfamily)